MTALLEARHLTKVFGGGLIHRTDALVALDDLSLAIEDTPPTITAIVGESGSGKTTFARLLLGLTEPTRGEVLYRGVDLRRLDRNQRRQFLRDVQAIFQDPDEVYNPFYKIDHVLQAPVTNFGLASSRAEGLALIEQALVSVGLRPEETLGRYPHQLSGGQRQRVMVARSLIVSPRLIIADEPVSMVDASLRATIIDTLRDLHRRLGISIIYISHDLTTAYQLSANIVVLYRGGVAEAGDIEQVVKQPEHPYTRLLIGAVPLPDPKRAWGKGESVAEGTEKVQAVRKGCRFTDRCPYGMPMCHEAMPPLFQTAPHRVTACYLYRESPATTSTRLEQIFVGQSLSSLNGNSHEGSAGEAPEEASRSALHLPVRGGAGDTDGGGSLHGGSPQGGRPQDLRR
jgi:peptide/nickel transport system ATP-binding protein